MGGPLLLRATAQLNLDSECSGRTAGERTPQQVLFVRWRWTRSPSRLFV
jgi:hypothetical protein